jgi:phosphoglycolate phosphatase-like HAD superfamily hydrolase
VSGREIVHTPAVRPTVLLFDIDGTLLDTGGAGRRAMDGAFERHYNGRNACAKIRFDGMTDRAIVRAGLIAIGEPSDASAIDAVLASYVALLEDEVARAAKYRVIEGVEVALRACEGRGSIAMGLGTGNVRAGAAIKLARAALFERFAFGGFGCDAEDRAELIGVGAARGAAKLGATVSECRVVVIGDTPKDIAAAKAIGAESIAVATGSFSTDELAACAPTFAFASLATREALRALLEAPALEG